MPLKELERAVLGAEVAGPLLRAGDVGVVVGVYRDGEAYEVEFFDADGTTLAVETLRADQVEPLAGRKILHVRTLTAA
ncbi:MAG: DUF4926 domain-containing protein [Chloroflexi bacterium]|nr:DUF4926 domain-containing protein [Chloroflexota bacterium]